MKHLIAALICALPVTGLAQSTCPDANDLHRGITFSVSEGESETFLRVSGDGVVRSTYLFEDGAGVQSMLGQGVYLLELIDTDETGTLQPDSRATFAFEKNAADLPVPTPGGGASFAIVVNDADGLRQERQIYAFGALTRAQYGPCSYDMIPVEIRYDPDEENTVDQIHYLPALGIGLFVRSTYDGGEDHYPYSNPRAVE